MGMFRHIINGVLPAGDIFSTGWSSESSVDLGTAHTATADWLNSFWGGSGGSTGYETLVSTLTIVTSYKTILYTPAIPLKTLGVLETQVNKAGTNANHSLPQSICVVASLRSSMPGPKGRGRMYLPAPCVDSVSAMGEFIEANQAACSTNLGVAFDVFIADGLTPVILSRTTGVAQNVVEGSVGTVFDLQLRRVNKVNTVRMPFAL